MAKTNIEWASHSLNVYTWDCEKVSEGCKNCYMMEMATRFGRPLVGHPQWRETGLKELRGYPSGAVIFVNSMSDTYIKTAPLEWIQRIHQAAAQHPDKTFLMLTKRPDRALDLVPYLIWPDNLWIGTSIEKQKYLSRLDTLLQIPAAGHFISAEPLLEPLPGLADYLQQGRGVGWVIVGGESGGKRRPFNKDWARQIRDMCLAANVPFLFKQGSAFKPGQDRFLDDRTWDDTPDFNRTL